MPFSLKYDHHTKIVEVVYSSSVSNVDLKNAIRERISMQNKNMSFSVLIDCSQVRYMECRNVEIYKLPHEVYFQENADMRTKHALIPSIYPNMRAISLQYKIVSVKRLWTVEIFEDRQDAIEWLL